MPAKTRTQPFDPSATFAVENEKERLEGLRSKVLPRLVALKDTALHEAGNAFDLEAEQSSDELERVAAKLLEVGLRPADGDYPGLRGVRSPAIELKFSATPDGVGAILAINSQAEWRLFIKTIYKHRELISDYISELEELYIFGEDDEEAIEEI